ncbi:N-acetylmuramidase domain-containing protein [Croceibacterium sp. TMG7-5b_MA50]|uniref:N-acetylmuramidase domain-containing protein n=1 Tax=Croceibacterium sp. TMG7-5b_MA50 TaxID=3121290 RepID=UPI0032217A3B
MSEFIGSGDTFSDGAIEQAAKALGCQVAAVRAVIDVESRGGYLTDKRPKILFERHYFSRLTGRRHDASNPDISHRRFGGYKGGAREYDRLNQAIGLNREAALRSASWGAFQIMGDNCKACGFDDVDDFVSAMVESEDRQLQAFVAFVKANRLDDELRRLDWEGFARGYNGPAFRANNYDKKMAAAFAFHAAGPPRTSAGRPLLKMGATGEDVEDLQEALGLKVDGDFGPATKRAVITFQQARGLEADGIVGAGTWEALADKLDRA